MVRRLAGLLSILLILLVAAPAGAEQQGVIEGQIVNKTAGGARVGEVEVVLRSWVGQEEREPTKGRTDVQGKFRFANLETGGDRAYAVSVEYQGVSYRSDIIIFQPGETAKSVELAVYEPTNQSDKIRVGRAHVIIDVDRQGQGVAVMEMLQLVNTGDRAYVGSREVKPGGPKETLRVTLPQDVLEVQFGRGQGDRFVPTDNGFVYTGPLVPGTTELVYSYLLAYTGDSLKLTRSVSYPIDRLNVLMPDQGIRLSGEQLSSQPVANIGNQRYIHLAGQDLPADTPVTLELSGLAAPVQSQEAVKWLVPGLVGVGMAVALGYPLWRRRRRSPSPRPSLPGELVEEEEELEPELRHRKA